MILNFKCSSVFEKNYNSKKKIVVNQGSSRSTKTYSILQLLIIDATEQTEESTTTIARKELSTLKVTAMRDFFDILKDQELYSEKNHNKTDCTYRLGKVLFEFVGLDSPTKKRGAKRRILFVNECNELTFEDWRQLIIRTTHKIYIDYNPSEEFHWIYDYVLTRDDCEYIHSTYKDNPFLEQTVIDEIERTQFEDENFWRVYGLGERGQSLIKIYNNWRVLSNEEWDAMTAKVNEKVYGLDFGYNVPTALIEIQEYENDVFLREIVYEKFLLNSQLIEKMKEAGVDRMKEIKADNAEPDKIKEIYNAGFNVHSAIKNVKDGILLVKRKKIFIHKDSDNLIKEIKSYSWKTDKTGRTLDEPVKANDHAMDSLRYGLFRKENPVFSQR